MVTGTDGKCVGRRVGDGVVGFDCAWLRAHGQRLPSGLRSAGRRSSDDCHSQGGGRLLCHQDAAFQHYSTIIRLKVLPGCPPECGDCVGWADKAAIKAHRRPLGLLFTSASTKKKCCEVWEWMPGRAARDANFIQISFMSIRRCCLQT